MGAVFSVTWADGEPRILGGPSPLVTSATTETNAVILLGRLHYCDPEIAPAAAVAHLYRKNTGSVDQLEGEFCCVVWDRINRRLLALRDPMGGYPLYWSVDGKTLRLSTRMAPLVGALGSADLSSSYLADYLTRPLTLSEPPSEQTVYRDISRVLPGQIVVWESPGTFRRWRYWDWPSRIDDPRTDRIEALAEQAEARLRPAVRTRIVGTPAAHFSGGMDSTTIALIARDQLRVSATPVHALALIYDDITSVRDETRYILDCARDQPGLVLHRVPADDLLAYDPVHSIGFDEPHPEIDLIKQQMLLRQAAELGVGSVLTGEGGDDVFDLPPYYLARMVRRGGVLRAWRDSSLFARRFATDPWPIFRRYALTPLIPYAWRGGCVLCGGRSGWKTSGTLAPWIRPEFARRYDLRDRGIAQLRQLWSGHADPAVAAALAGIATRVGDVARWTLAAPLGLTLSHPFLDPRLLRLGLGMALRCRLTADGQKPVLAHLASDLLPASVLRRRQKTHYNEVYYKGLVRNKRWLQEAISRSPLDAFMDKEVLTECLTRAALGVGSGGYEERRLDAALSLVRWMDHAG